MTREERLEELRAELHRLEELAEPTLQDAIRLATLQAEFRAVVDYTTPRPGSVLVGPNER